MAELCVSPEAANDLRKIQQYIAAHLDAPVAAQKLVSRILKSMRGLADFPESGPNLSSVLNIETDYRFQVCGNYLIFYRVEKQTVFIVRRCDRPITRAFPRYIAIGILFYEFKLERRISWHANWRIPFGIIWAKHRFCAFASVPGA
ncbi:type II toxin-antitoxin system RelE/ParE family toxin [Caproicibacter fermentans]|uniref:Type II toxin-antitoxin system RelE/ParE family toxin n=1 Tax=Caproicibacter fermentans TaxID=2576756 RepID=A0A7G8TAX6_9FIRM|nr:type II toxin-antitoxin system RelE/ParE family toxin [Caproicibacter fermentans]